MYENLIEKKTASEEIYKGRLLHVYKDTVELSNGAQATREYIKHNGAVALVPLFDDGTVLIEKQFRYPFGKVVTEIPAGKIDPGEEPLAAAHRELREECGVISGDFIPIGELYPSVAYTTEVIYMYVVKNMTFGENDLDEDEFLETRRVPLEDVYKMILDGEIGDSKTQAAILKVCALIKEGRI